MLAIHQSTTVSGHPAGDLLLYYNQTITNPSRPSPTPLHPIAMIIHIRKFVSVMPPSPSPATACAIRPSAPASGHTAWAAASYTAAPTARGAADWPPARAPPPPPRPRAATAARR